MRRKWLRVLIVLAFVIPAVAQEGDFEGDGDDPADIFGGYGDSSGQQGQRGNNPQGNPLAQFDEVLGQAGIPLSEEQRTLLTAKMEEQRKSMREAIPGGGPAEGQRGGPGSGQPGRAGAGPGGRRGSGMPTQMANRMEAFQESLLSILTPDQQKVWKEYQTAEIRRRGGYPALRLMLEEAGSPLSEEQALAVQSEYRDYFDQRRALRPAVSSQADAAQPDAAKLKEMEDQHLSRLIKLLNAEQRKALIESRRKETKGSN
ncbi:MAG: hypothetical protein A3F68_09025 [Acidobacteria bacterium RIFCSPLOWO2_12_FULL_54_10]|nr:MAG: hypothetical protein A3F68_09025 [Acidobacteria bacterium RIFCSPLOWO2_12_FULL_54_10]